jgi:predicted AAA+ superfamily ATPase
MLRRATYHQALREALERNPVVMLAGPRQCGKSTLAKELLPEDSSAFFDLEDPTVRAAMSEPMTTLRDLRGLVVIDEAQRHPELFPVLRVLADRRDTPARFLLLGSASPELSRQSAESLAGRVELIELRGFDTSEVGTAERNRLWVRGGLPRSFLADTDADSYRWRQQFISTFLERDLGVLGFGMAPKAMERFWKMLSHYHGQIWNASEIAASMGVSPHTTRSYLDALEQTYMVRTLQPWYVNLGKRLVKSPKIYLRDSGIFHSLQGIHDRGELLTHPKLGASWEGFALEEVLAAFKPDEAWYYAVHSGSELDLFFRYKGKRVGVEFKRMDAPRMTKGMRVVLQDLELDQLYVIYPGARRYPLDERAEAVPLEMIGQLP